MTYVCYGEKRWILFLANIPTFHFDRVYGKGVHDALSK
jgi:hypothetical protein